MRPLAIIVHHSASPESTTIDQIRHWHTDPPPQGKGWSAIGYHAVVLADGTVVATRPEDAVGAHAIGMNGLSLGICLAGSFEDGHPVPAVQWAAATQQVLNWMIRYQIPFGRVYGHKEVRGASTLCPGFDPELFRTALRGLSEAKC